MRVSPQSLLTMGCKLKEIMKDMSFQILPLKSLLQLNDLDPRCL